MKFDEILTDAGMERAREVIRKRDPDTIDEQIRLASIPAPSGYETARGAYVLRRFRELGLRATESDAVGNVLGLLDAPTIGRKGGAAPLLVTAHLDTIFPDGTETTPRVRDGRICGPGITDNARGLAALLALVDAILASELRLNRPLLFAGTVGEEGLGDLRGVKHLFRPGSPHRYAAGFISIDGAGLTRIVTRAIGARRLRAEIRGTGGHSWGDRGRPNPIHALGAAIDAIRRLGEEGEGERAVNVGRTGGGTSVNAIPSDAWLELDLRSGDEALLERLEKDARRILRTAVAEEGASGGDRSPLRVSITRIGDRPCGSTASHTELVKATVAATLAVGGSPELTASSTDANVPMSIGVPAIAIGAGGRGGGVHTLDEWFENKDGFRGIERALLSITAAAGIEAQPQRD